MIGHRERAGPPDAGNRAGRSRRPLVEASWERCDGVDGLHDPFRRPPERLIGGPLADYRDAHPLRTSLRICRDLLGDTVRDTGSVFALGDANGLLMWVEGERTARARLERIGFREGMDWSETTAGTNAPGTALVVGSPLQIVSEEHYNEAVRSWSCAAAPIHDPATGRLLGVVDMTGGECVAAPHALALVRATARAAEAELARALVLGEIQVGETGGRSGVPRMNHGWRVVHSRRLAEETGGLSPAPGQDVMVLPDGRRLLVRPLGTTGYVVVRGTDGAGPDRRGPGARLFALGRHSATLELDGRRVRLGCRHSEILVLLALAEEGLSAARLAVDLFPDNTGAATVRVAMSRLRDVVGDDLVGSQPYAFRRPVRADIHVVRDLLADGSVSEALKVYAGPLLPGSEAPAVAEHRSVLEQQVRGAVLASREPDVLRRWVNASWGTDDLLAWEALARRLPPGSPQFAAASSRAKALRSGS